MTIIKRANLGRPLTWDELDSNFSQVEDIVSDANAVLAEATAQAQSAQQSANSASQSVTQANQAVAVTFNNTHELWKRSLSEVGISLVMGSFEEGGTLNSTTDALWYRSGAQSYTWTGAFPKVIGASSAPDLSDVKWVSVSGKSLKSLLAATDGVNYVNGAAKSVDLKALSSFATPEQYSSLVVSGDWSDAIQSAFNTGKPVIFDSSKVYNVSKIITTKGQSFFGDVKLNITRTSVTAVQFTGTYSPPDKNSFRGIYVQSEYDWCELLQIKSLGLNTVLHYCYFDNNGTIDSAGTIPQLVLNAKSAGMNVVVNTQNSAGHNHGSVADVINSVDSYENVIGYSIIDEPGSAGHTLAEQEAAISTARALTSKKLYSVDFVWRLNTWSKPWSYNYDVFLVDSYSMYYASGSTSDKINKDLGKFRTDFGASLKMTGNARVIPCFQAYADPVSNPVEGISGTYCFDLNQIIPASRVFGKVGNGDFACFIWDGGMPTNVRNSTLLQNLVKEVANHAGKGERYETRPLVFGGVGSAYQRSLNDIYAAVAFKDPNNTIDSWLGGGAWPVRLTTGANETPIFTTTTGINIAGIGFESSFSRLVTNHNALLYVTGFGVFENYGPTITGSASLDVFTTADGGYSQTNVYSGGVSGGTPFRFSSKTTNSYDGIGSDLVIGLSLSNSSDYNANYRRFVYGMFVTTNW